MTNLRQAARRVDRVLDHFDIIRVARVTLREIHRAVGADSLADHLARSPRSAARHDTHVEARSREQA